MAPVTAAPGVKARRRTRSTRASRARAKTGSVRWWTQQAVPTAAPKRAAAPAVRRSANRRKRPGRALRPGELGEQEGRGIETRHERGQERPGRREPEDPPGERGQDEEQSHGTNGIEKQGGPVGGPRAREETGRDQDQRIGRGEERPVFHCRARQLEIRRAARKEAGHSEIGGFVAEQHRPPERQGEREMEQQEDGRSDRGLAAV